MKKILILNREKKKPRKTNKQKRKYILHALVDVYGHSDLTDLILIALAVQEE